MISAKKRKLAAHEWQYHGMAQRWKERAYKVSETGNLGLPVGTDSVPLYHGYVIVCDT